MVTDRPERSSSGWIGLRARQFGYAADHVRAVEIVTAEGRARRLEPGDELFGAVLGSGGNLGVVTALEVELFDVRTVYGGQHCGRDALCSPRARCVARGGGRGMMGAGQALVGPGTETT